MSTAAVRTDFHGFYEANFGDTVAMTYGLIADLDEAHDITQEAFCRAWQHWQRLSSYENPAMWVRRVATNLAYSRWRQLRVAAAHRRKVRTDETHSPTPGPDHVAIVAGLRKLPGSQRTAVVLHHLLDLPVAHVAEELDVPVGTIKGWLHRARQALAVELAIDPAPVPVRMPAAEQVIARSQKRRRAGRTAVALLVLALTVAAALTLLNATTSEPITPPPPSSPRALCTFQTDRGSYESAVTDSETLARGKLVKDDEALIIKSTTSSAQAFVLWRGRLFEVKQQVAERLAPGVQATAVVPAFINGLPKGDPIQKIAVTKSGAKSRFSDLWKVGEVLAIYGVTAEDRYVLVREDGLFYVTQLQAQLADFNGQRRSYDEVTAGGLQIKHDLLPRGGDVRQPPANLPTFITVSGSGLCWVLLDDERIELRTDVPLG